MGLPNVLSHQDADRIMQTFNTACPTGLRNRLMPVTSYLARPRGGVGVGPRPMYVNLSVGYSALRLTKGARPRNVPIADPLLPWLQLWAGQRPESSWFFCTIGRRAGHQISTRYVRRVVDRAAMQSGLDPSSGSPHTFRHSFATQCLNEGLNVREVQQLLGHADLGTTMLYLHVRPEELRAKLNARPAERIGRMVADDIADLPEDSREVLQAALALTE